MEKNVLNTSAKSCLESKEKGYDVTTQINIKYFLAATTEDVQFEH